MTFLLPYHRPLLLSTGNLAPDGAMIKAVAVPHQMHIQVGRARIFVTPRYQLPLCSGTRKTRGIITNTSTPTTTQRR